MCYWYMSKEFENYFSRGEFNKKKYYLFSRLIAPCSELLIYIFNIELQSRNEKSDDLLKKKTSEKLDSQEIYKEC